ncbi:helix-turn-helix domain-containing protein [Natrinema sp. HArc-T2]|uniref:helix-turn-helix domain-containing protein n=1 Tax=Natrinema sp. HArc-T2 TaxID=3242701 RepID=UPI00359E2406
MSTGEHQLAVPDQLTSPQAKLVYLSLLVTGEAKAADLEQLLGLPKLTLFAVLESLAAQDLIQRTGECYVCQ